MGMLYVMVNLGSPAFLSGRKEKKKNARVGQNLDSSTSS